MKFWNKNGSILNAATGYLHGAVSTQKSPCILTLVAGLSLLSADQFLGSAAQASENPGPLQTITSVGNAALDTTPSLLADVPEPPGLGNFVQNRTVLLKHGHP
jgi:hypothetical protein